MTLTALFAAGIFSASVAALSCYLQVAARFQIVDVPNERSSHTRRTLRGGGVIFAPFLLLLAIWFPAVRVLALCSALIAAVGFVDDLRGVSASIRLALHLGGAALVLGLAPGAVASPLWLAASLGAIVYSTNTFNFIDGIDGILAGMSVAGTAWLALLLSGTASSVYFAGLVPVLLAFLRFNWQPARVFMGDVGSGFLGFSLSAAAVIATVGDARGLWLLAIVFAPLFGDAALTLLARLFRGENIFKAHRSHAYQKISVRWGSHARVSLLYSGYVLLICGPFALAAEREWISPVVAALAAYFPVVAFWWLIESGASLSSKLHRATL